MLKVPLTKIERNEKTALFFILLYILMNLSAGFYIIPQIDHCYEKGVGIGFAVCSFLLFLAFCFAALIRPGYIMRDTSIDFQELLNTTDAYNICPDCKVIRTPRSRH
jgi:hypothetical protein